MNRKLKKRLIRIIITLILFIPLFIIDKIYDLSSFINPNGFLLPLFIYLAIYLFISYDILIKAIKNIRHGRIFDENFLMIIATIGAFIIKEFPEAVMVMLLYQIGEFFQSLAVNSSRREIASLMDIRPDIARRINEDGTIEELDPLMINVNDLIRVEPGEKIPLDGYVISGKSDLDTKALTGESLPRFVKEGDPVISGTINLTSNLDIKANKDYESSAVNKILELVENSTSTKSKQEAFISKFAKYYTPIVVISAFLLFLLGSLISGNWEIWTSRALNFLVVSCPCAIVISVPLSFFTSIGRAAKLGILIKGSLYLENFNKAKTYVFDKTGTLTKGNFKISKILPIDKKEEILYLAALAESNSLHPIAMAIKENVSIPFDKSITIDNVLGKGIIAKKDENIIYVGNKELLKDNNIEVPLIEEIGTLVYVGKNNTYIGVIIIEDEIKEESYELISYLKKNNIKTIMLTGDNDKVAYKVANNLSLDEYKSALLPMDKVEAMKNIIQEKKKGELVVYIGDGINDAPTLAMSDIGVSMGGVGSDAAIEASDIVLMHDNLSSLLIAKKIAKKTMRIVKENIIFAIFVKILILVLSIFGLANLYLAIFGDVGVALLCVINALRSGKVDK